MTIPTLPPVPSRTAPSETQFAAAAETFLGALNPWGQEVNATGVLVASNALLATNAAATATAAANRAEAASGFRVSIAAASWTALAAITGSYAGQSAAVFGDAGTHTDPVVGGTVDNTGRYAWSVSPAGWQWIDDGAAGSISWGDITDKPEEFTPEAHTHAISDITDLSSTLSGKLAITDAPELIRDTIGTALVAGDGVTITVNDASDTITIAASGGGGSYPASGIPVSTGSAWATSLAVPTGNLVGTTASQTLTNKTLGSGTSITGGNATGLTLQAGCTVDDTGTITVSSPGFRGAPQVTGTTRTLQLSDAGRMIHVSGNITIPANSSVAFPIGTIIILSNNSGTNSTVSITSDTLRLSGASSTGSRTLAGRGTAFLMKVNTTEWKIGGDVS